MLRAKKSAKMKKQQSETAEKSQTKPEKPSLGCEEEGKPDKEKTYQVSIISHYHPSFISCALFSGSIK